MKVDKKIIDKILQKYSSESDCYIHLVEVIGRRNSFICGSSPEYPLLTEIEELTVKKNYKLSAQPKSGSFSKKDLLSLKETGEIIGKYLP